MSKIPTSHTSKFSTGGPIKVILIRVGGNGSRMLGHLKDLHLALQAHGAAGLQVCAVDPDTVSPSNLVRQTFYPSEIGRNKAEVLVSRLNLGYGLEWKAFPQTAEDFLRNNPNFSYQCDLIITCVDSGASRAALAHHIPKTLYHLDLGNGKNYGQFILGGQGLPLPFARYPQLLQDDEEDLNTPSCSALESLQRQDLMINSTLATLASALLWHLISQGQLDYVGAFLSLERFEIQKIPLCVPKPAKLPKVPRVAQLPRNLSSQKQRTG